MPDPLISAKLKINRADQEIADVEGAVDSFLQAAPYRITEHFDPDGIHVTKKLHFEPLPPELIDGVGTACSFLRSALDKLACALARQEDATVSIRDVSFPISDSAKEFFGDREQRKIRKLGADAQSLLSMLKPYKGGNNTLWALNQLRRADIHQDMLIPIGSQIESFAMTGPITLTTVPGQVVAFRGPALRLGGGLAQALEDGADILTLPVDSLKQDPNLKIAVRISVRNIEFAERQPVIALLKRFSNRTKRILLLFEKRFF